jgi:hypothetical protein
MDGGVVLMTEVEKVMGMPRFKHEVRYGEILQGLYIKNDKNSHHFLFCWEEFHDSHKEG